MKCENCKWWDNFPVDEGEKLGQCRRSAPIPRHFLHIEVNPPDKENAGAYDIEWPFTEYNEWCGEFIKK